jgi:hypothetical protein
MQTRRDTAGFAGLLAAEAAGLVALARLGARPGMAIGWADPGRWLASAAPADAVIAVLRLVGLACAGWLLVTTLAYAGARMLRSQRRWSLLERMTLPVVRRLADRAVAVVLATSSVTGGAAWAAEPVLVPPGAQAVTVEQPAADAPQDVPAETADGVVTGVPALGRRPAGRAAQGTPSDGSVWVVAEGDHLWGIARELLVAERVTGAPAPSDREVHARWLTLLAVNADRLSSGDPDRIFPGEELLVAREPAPLTPPGTADPHGG